TNQGTVRHATVLQQLGQCVVIDVGGESANSGMDRCIVCACSAIWRVLSGILRELGIPKEGESGHALFGKNNSFGVYSLPGTFALITFDRAARCTSLWRSRRFLLNPSPWR